MSDLELSQKTPIYTVNAFSSGPFTGNTCAVCIFENWPEDDILLKIAQQNKFAETAFILPPKQPQDLPELRWFTVDQEVEFCGYGTLSAAYVWIRFNQPDHTKAQSQVTFKTRYYGQVTITKQGDGDMAMELETKKVNTENITDTEFQRLHDILGGSLPQAIHTTEQGNLIILYHDEQEMISIAPDFNRLMHGSQNYYGYILTAPATDPSNDYAYRYFSPRMTGTWEDPVNGSSQLSLAPFWAARLNKSQLQVKAASQRGGVLHCDCPPQSDTMKIRGQVTLYLSGFIYGV